MNPYQILGVKPDASESAIKQAYRALAKQHHPDAGGDPEKFRDLALAYSVLSDPERRDEYDQTGRMDTVAAFSEMQAVAGAIAQMIQQMLEKNPYALETADVVAQMRQAGMMGLESEKRAVDGLSKQVRSLEKLRSRVKRNNEEENIFLTIIDEKIKLLRLQLANHTQNRKIASRLIEVLENYSTPVDAMRGMQGMMYANRVYSSNSASSNVVFY